MADERVITVPFTYVYARSHRWRARKASQFLKAFLSRHMKVPESDVVVSAQINEALWSGGRSHPPRRLKLVVKKEDGRAFAELEGVKLEASPVQKKEAKPVKAVEGMPAEKHAKREKEAKETAKKDVEKKDAHAKKEKHEQPKKETKKKEAEKK